MDLLHIILAFNLVTTLGILVGGYVLYRGDGVALSRPSPDRYNGRHALFNLAGLSGAVLALGLMSGVARMFA